MPYITVIGEAMQTAGDITVEWKVPSFWLDSEKVENVYDSPPFRFGDTVWCLRLFPKGDKANPSSKWVGLFLVRMDNKGSPQTLYYAFGTRSSDGVQMRNEVKFKSPSKLMSWGSRQFLTRSEFRNKKSKSDYRVRILCDLRNNPKSSVKNEKRLQDSLLNILKSGDNSDVVIKVRGKKFPAHRVILQARSAVFSSMFTHDMVERQSGVVTIDDCDPDTFQDFLAYIYSGSPDRISWANVRSLYAAADKYDVGDLREECAEFMGKNMTGASFCDVITIAIKHQDKRLMGTATEFFCEKTLDIVTREDWINFQSENLVVGNELVVSALSK